MKIESGQMSGGWPFIRFGQGQEKIIIFPPINDALFKNGEIAWYFYYLFSPFAGSYSIYVLGRRRSLPVGYSTRDMAADYAEVFKQASLGRVNLIGISLGGMIAQQFAYHYPQYVQRLILIASAHHMGPEGFKIARRWTPWSRAGMWKEIYDDFIEYSYKHFFRLFFFFLKPFFVSSLKHKKPDDFIIAGQAGIIHDSSDLLSSLKMPVLLIGGTEDRFFPEPLFYEMTEAIKQAQLLMIKGAAHGVFEEHRRVCIKTISEFLKKNQPVLETAIPMPEGP